MPSPQNVQLAVTFAHIVKLVRTESKISGEGEEAVSGDTLSGVPVTYLPALIRASMPARAGPLTREVLMRRRDLIALLAGSAAVGPGRAQAPGRTRRVGVIDGLSESDPEGHRRLAAFRDEMKALGWTEGRNLDMTVRWAAGDAARAQAGARDLIQMGPEVVLANSGPVVAAIQRESSRVPVVFVQVVDPVGRGLVDSLARPGRNLTGLTHFEPAMGGKWLAAPEGAGARHEARRLPVQP